MIKACVCVCIPASTLLSLKRTACQLARASGPSSLANWLASLCGASARGPDPTSSLSSGMCSSNQTNLTHRPCHTLLRGSILPFGTRLLDYLPVLWHQQLFGSGRLFYHASVHLSGSEKSYLLHFFFFVKEGCCHKCPIQQRWVKTEWWRRSSRG